MEYTFRLSNLLYTGHVNLIMKLNVTLDQLKIYAE